MTMLKMCDRAWNKLYLARFIFSQNLGKIRADDARFWLTSGWHLLIRDENGHMVPTVDFMRAYFMRDEVAPEADLVRPNWRFTKTDR